MTSEQLQRLEQALTCAESEGALNSEEADELDAVVRAMVEVVAAARKVNDNGTSDDFCDLETAFERFDALKNACQPSKGSKE